MSDWPEVIEVLSPEAAKLVNCLIDKAKVAEAENARLMVKLESAELGQRVTSTMLADTANERDAECRRAEKAEAERDALAAKVAYLDKEAGKGEDACNKIEAKYIAMCCQRDALAAKLTALQVELEDTEASGMARIKQFRVERDIRAAELAALKATQCSAEHPGCGVVALETTLRIDAEAACAVMREMIESMIAARGSKYTEAEMPPESHAEKPHEPCPLCLRRNEMLIHNSIIENMERSIAPDLARRWRIG